MKKDYSRAMEMRNPITNEVIGYIGVSDIEDGQQIKKVLQDIINKESDDYGFEDFNQVKIISGNEMNLILNKIEPKGLMNYSKYEGFFKYMKEIEELDITSISRPCKNISELVNGKSKLRVLKLRDVENLKYLKLVSKDLEVLDLKNISNLERITGIKDASKLKKISIRFENEFNPKLLDSISSELHELLNSPNTLEELTLPFNVINSMSNSLIKRVEALTEKGLKVKFLDDDRYEIDLDMLKMLLEFREKHKELLKNKELTDLEKMALAHLYVSRKVTYAHDKLRLRKEIDNKIRSCANKDEKQKYIELREKSLLTTQTAHAALINKDCVCAGYASAFVFLVNTMGLQGSIVSVAAGEGTDFKPKASSGFEVYVPIAESGSYHAIAKGFIDGQPYYFDPTWDAGKDKTHYKYSALTKEQMEKTHRFEIEKNSNSEVISPDLKKKAFINALYILNGMEREYETFEMTNEEPKSVRQMKERVEKIKTAYQSAISSKNNEKADRMISLGVEVKKNIENKREDYNGISLQNLLNKEEILDEVINKTKSDKAYYLKDFRYSVIPHQLEKDVVVTSKRVNNKEVHEIFVIDSQEKEIVAKYASREVKNNNGDPVMVVESEETKEQYLLKIEDESINLYNKEGRIFENKVLAVRRRPKDKDEMRTKFLEKYGDRIQGTIVHNGETLYIVAPDCGKHKDKEYGKPTVNPTKIK